MRNILMGILLTSAAVSPALAQDNGRWHRGGQQTEQSGDDRAQAREERREAREQDKSGARAQAAAEFRQRAAESPEGRARSGTWDRNRSGTWDRNRSGSWNRDWRNDRRYDWRNYRDRHRSTFRLGVYFDPFGYGYRPYDIGYRLAPAYFGQRYWIDPAMYQLPYPPPGTQWVRYWNDAVL